MERHVSSIGFDARVALLKDTLPLLKRRLYHAIAQRCKLGTAQAREGTHATKRLEQRRLGGRRRPTELRRRRLACLVPPALTMLMRMRAAAKAVVSRASATRPARGCVPTAACAERSPRAACCRCRNCSTSRVEHARSAAPKRARDVWRSMQRAIR